MSVAFKLNELKQTWIGYAQELLQRDDIGKIIDALINASEKLEGTLDVLAPVIEKTINIIANLIEVIGNVVSVTGGATPVIIGFIAAFKKRDGLKEFKKDLLSIGNTIKKFGKLGKLITTPDLLNTVLNTKFDDSKGIFANISTALESALKEGAKNSTEVIAETLGDSTEAVKDVAGEVIGDSVVDDIKESTEILKDNIENEVKDIVDETGDFMEDMFMEQYNPDDNPMTELFENVDEADDVIDQFSENIDSTNNNLNTAQKVIEEGTAVKEASIGADEANTKSTLEESVANEIEKDASLDSAVADEIEKDASLAAAGADAGEAAGSGVSGAANGMTIATKIGSKLETVLSGLAAAWPLVAAGAAIGAAAFYKWYTSCEQVVKRTDKAIDKIFELRDTFQEEADNAKESAEKLEDLAEKYQNAVEGSSEYYDIANKIAELEPSLIIGWTSEGDTILTTTEKIQDQVQAYKDLAEAKRLALEEENKGIVNEYANGDNALGLYKRKVEETKADIEHYNEEIEKLSDPKNGAAYAQERYNNSADIQIKAFENLRKEATKDLEVYAQKAAELEGKVHSAYASLLPTKDDLSDTEKLLRDVVIDIGVSTQLDSDSFNDLYEQAEKTGKDIFKKLFTLQGNEELSTKEYQRQAEELFNELVAALHLENDEEGKLALRVSLKIDPKSYADAEQEAVNWAEKNGYKGTTRYVGSELIQRDEDAIKWYQDLNEEQQKIANSDEFTEELEKQKLKFDSITDACNAAYDAVKAYGNETDEQGHKSVNDALEKIVVGKDVNDKDITGKDRLDEYYEKADAIDEIIKKITNGDYTDIDLTQWRIEYDLVGESAEEIIKELGETKEAAKQAAIEVLDKLIESHPNDKELIKSLTQIKDSINNISEASKKLKGNASIANTVTELENLSKVYESFKENSKNGIPVNITDVEALREVWGDLDSFEEFERLLTTTGSSATDVQNAFDQLSTEYVNTKIDLDAINESTKTQIASQLELAGITKESAKEFVDYYANLNEFENNVKDNLNIDELFDDVVKSTTVENISKQLNELEKGGNVDLNIRPVVDTEELKKADWKKAGDGIATVFTEAFTDDLGTKTINFTPIIVDENGNKVGVMSEDKFEEYCFNVVNGVHDDFLHLQIGAEFNGEEQIEEAGKAGIKIHELHEELYDLTGAIDTANNGIESNKQKLAEEAEQLGITTETLAYYIFEEQLADMQKIDTSSEVSSLISLAGQANVTGECIEKLIELEQIYLGLEAGVYGKGTEDMAKAMTKATQLQKEIQGLYETGTVKKDVKVSKNAPKVKFQGAKDSKGSGGDKDSKETFDWIETKIQRIERDITNLGKTADATYKTWTERTTALGQEMEKVNEQISLQESAYNAYMAKAESVGLSAQYKKLVQSGALKIDEITDETLKEQIQNYKEWYEKALDAKDKVEDLKKSLADLAKVKFDNITSQFDDIISDIDHMTKYITSQLESVETIGKIAGKSFYEAQIAQEQQRVNELTDELAQLQNALAEGLASGAIAYGSQMWAEMKKSIYGVEESIWDANNAILEFEQNIKNVAKENFDDLKSQFESAIEILTSKIDLTDKIVSMVQNTGHIASKAYYQAMIDGQDQNIKNLKKKENELTKVFEEAVANGDIEEYSENWYSMKNSIESVKGEILDAASALIEYKNAMRQIDWDLFDRGQTRLEQLVSESQFLIDLYSKYPLFDKETGDITDKGMATRGLLVQNYETYISQARQLQEEIAKLKEELKADPGSTTLIDRIKELEQAERDAILSSEGVKESLRDLLENEINALLDALDKLVNKYIEALNRQKD